MILEEETFEKFGYYPSDLAPKSHKKILATCDDCGKIRKIERSAYHPRCKSCAKKGKNNSNWKDAKIKRICKQCGKEFCIFRSQIQYGYGVFCSNKCQDKWRSENLRDAKAPGWKGGKIKRKCIICQKEFEINSSEIKKGNGNYCSYSCSRKAQKMPKHHTKPELIFERICKKYNLPFKYTGDGSFWIHNINPDFIECNGKKVAIEIFGDWWHSPLLNWRLTERSTLPYRKKSLKKYSWELIVLWGSDLKREDAEQFVLLELSKYTFLPSFQ